ncbi:hypothetical protein M2323_000582 [Rhodoblastus acidophilus]|nr:hypothetical protein [Rhodoblastus acidophilus]MCW2331678.1 hypothetical protein [Rhodoblastus acidophilus]
MARFHSRNPHFSRRALLGGMPAGCAAALPVGEASAHVKLSKDAVRFKKLSADDRTCRSCALFVAPSSCAFVEGPIEPEGTCWIWRARGA